MNGAEFLVPSAECRVKNGECMVHGAESGIAVTLGMPTTGGEKTSSKIRPNIPPHNAPKI